MNKFFVKYFLLVVLLFLGVLIINERNNKTVLDVSLKEIPTSASHSTIKTNVTLYVANEDDVLIPMNVEVNRKVNYQLKGYESLLMGPLDTTVYYTFAMLTNQSNHLPVGVRPMLPRTTKLLDYDLNGNQLILQVTDDIYAYNKEKEYDFLASLIHTYHQSLGVDYIQLMVNDRAVTFKGYSKIWIDVNDFPINPVESSREHSETKLTVFYYVDVEDALYLVPVSIYAEAVVNKEALIKHYLTNGVSKPVVTFTDQSDQARIQQELSLMENGLMESSLTKDLTEINRVQINLSVE
jgi:Sporulation and spore germination